MSASGLSWIWSRGAIRYASFQRTIEAVRLEGNVVIVMGAETARPTGDAPSAGQTVRRRFTNIWKNEGERWRMIARHANDIARE
jgi:ketosteroid isomerase-like protein